MENKEKLEIEASEYLNKWISEHRKELEAMFRDDVLFGTSQIHINNETTD